MDKVLFTISSSFVSIAEVYVWGKLFNQKYKCTNFILFISILFMSIIGAFNYFYVSVFVRIFLISLLLSIFNWLIFKRKLNEIIISVLIVQFLLALSEIIYFIFLIFILHIDIEFIQSSIIGTFFGNLTISLILLLVGKIPFINFIYSRLVIFTSNLKRKYIIIMVMLLIFSINILMATIYYKLNFSFIVVINFVLLLVYFFITYRVINERSINNLIKTENDSLMMSLHQYEDMVDRQRVDNHENKNQLLIIKNMIKKKDKDVVKYINTLVKDQMEDDEALYTRVMAIPSGGLQGIIYQKMLVMKDEHIDFNLDVGRGIRDFRLDDLSIDDNYKLCKIIGVFLDNAIDESRKIDDKCIMISLYMDENDFVIEILLLSMKAEKLMINAL